MTSSPNESELTIAAIASFFDRKVRLFGYGATGVSLLLVGASELWLTDFWVGFFVSLVITLFSITSFLRGFIKGVARSAKRDLPNFMDFFAENFTRD